MNIKWKYARYHEQVGEFVPKGDMSFFVFKGDALLDPGTNVIALTNREGKAQELCNALNFQDDAIEKLMKPLNKQTREQESIELWNKMSVGARWHWLKVEGFLDVQCDWMSGRSYQQLSDDVQLRWQNRKPI